MKTKHYLLLLFGIGLGAFTSTRAQFTSIPDPQFEQFLFDEGIDLTAGDGRVLTSRIETIKSLSFNFANAVNYPLLSDLTGLEDFRDLETFFFQGAPIFGFDFSQNENIQSVLIDSPVAVTITFGSIAFPKPDLTTLTVSNFQGSSIDLSNLPNLTLLNLGNNQLTAIDVSNNPLLTRFWLNDNSLTSVDLSNNPLLEQIRLQGNQLTTIDLGANTSVLSLEVQNNQLTDINTTNLSALRFLDVRNNLITTLDISQNGQIRELIASNVPSLGNANLANGNNANFLQVRIDNNPNLSCIQVDDPNNNVSSIVKDAATTFSSNCAPFITLSGVPTQITNENDVFTITAEFSTAVTGFDAVTDIIGTNLTIDAPPVALSATSYTFNIGANSVCGSGNNVTIQIPSGAAQDANSGAGNVTSPIYTANVVDSVNPIAITQNITVQLNSDGEASIGFSAIDNGSTDNCLITNRSLDRNFFTCTDLGANTVTLTITDATGNTDSATAIVTVEDNVAPTVVAQDITLDLPASGQLVLNPADIDNGSSDNCGTVSLSVSPSTFDCSNTGFNTVTLTATDASGNSSNTTATLTLRDNAAFTTQPQDITVQLDANGEVDLNPEDFYGGLTPGCGFDVFSIIPNQLTCANIGANTVIVFVSRGATNSSRTVTVTVEDTIAPTVITQDITVQLDTNGQVSISPVDIENGSSDNCTAQGDLTYSLDTTNFECASLGTNTVTLSVTDAFGNTGMATAIVTVEDSNAPAAVAQDITVQLAANGQVSITGADVDNGSSDNCSVNLSVSPSTFDCSNLGANTVTLTVTDPSGNTDTATAVVTVEDNQPLTAIAQDITVQLDVNGQATITPQDVDNGSGSGCGNISLSLDTTSFDCSNIGQNTVTLTVTEGPNTETATAIVTVEDTIPPSVIPQVIAVQLDGNGQASITPTDIDNGSADNCGIATRILDITSFDCSNIGANTVTLTVTDNEGNVGSSTTTVTVTETVAPTSIAQDITVQLDASGNVSITASQIDNGSTDNCSIDTLSLDQTDFDCTDLGTNTVTLTVTDTSGNSATATAVVTVEEDPNQPLTAIAQDITVQLDANGSVTITPQDVDNGSNSGCNSNPTLSLDIDTFDCSNLGTNTVTLTATQGSITSTATATVTVADSVAPVVVTQDITLTLDANNTATITTSDINNGSTDNCTADTDLTYSVDTTSFDCSNLGANTVTLTVTDAEGNTATG
ncbi:hypothetical protein ABN763_00005, partial [Spongiivirga sp. MCCC 1A20706]|uniref:beta strand repeat-containing protein n=1 Tax=Spongiivirga sp. MCCC 1A20706 TaxID=3160963 RepID=UPI0039775533